MSKQAQSWFRHAREDLMGAEYNLKGPDECLAVAGFLAQQSVEKAIKGFLVLHRKRFTKTHNITTLLEIRQDRRCVSRRTDLFAQVNKFCC